MERVLVFKMIKRSRDNERNGEESKANTTHPMIKMSLVREKSIPAESQIHKQLNRGSKSKYKTMDLKDSREEK